MSKFCVVCGKLLTGGQRKLCSEKCRKENKKEYLCEWRQNNPKYQREYYQNNREERLDYVREYRQNNLERIKEKDRERGRKYYRANKKMILGNNYRYRQNNPEKIKEYGYKRYQDNQEKMKEYGRKKYRLDRGLPEDADLHKESSIEIITREWLQENNIKFIPQYYINLENSTWTRADFYISYSNICLYVDGNYYHLLPGRQESDARINKVLKEMGYKVIRLTETEILKGDRPWELKN